MNLTQGHNEMLASALYAVFILQKLYKNKQQQNKFFMGSK